MANAFVILAHTGHGAEHYDLMLERAGALATWQLTCLPASLEPGRALPARKLPDHRTAYLDYEGPVRGGRGSVRRAAGGTYEALLVEPDCWVIRLASEGGALMLELRRAGSGGRWTVTRVTRSPGQSPADSP